MIRHSRILALALAAAALSLVVATLAFMLLDPGGAADSGGVSDVLFLALPIAFSVVGAGIALRRPETSVGWLCLAIALLWSLQASGWSAAHWAANGGKPGTAEWVGLLGQLWLPAVVLTGTHLTLRLPSGSLLAPCWRWVSRSSTAALVVLATLIFTAPGEVAEVPGTHNPIASHALQALGPLFVLLPLCVAGAITSLVLRYRRAVGLELLQIRWIALGGFVFLGAVVVAQLPIVFGLASKGSAPAAVDAVVYLAFTAIPVAIAIAVLRYRLYDIDVVINRTLVYGALTATLAATYLASVLLLQLALGPVTSGSSLAVAVSTLAVAALFGPARARIQGVVDRRFYRRKYDAQRTLEGFGVRLRDEVDLDALSAALGWVVSDTMQPAHVSLWLRRTEARPR